MVWTPIDFESTKPSFMATCQVTFALRTRLARPRSEGTLAFAVLLNKFISCKKLYFFVTRLCRLEKNYVAYLIGF
jgi:hypothetical protein